MPNPETGESQAAKFKKLFRNTPLLAIFVGLGILTGALLDGVVGNRAPYSRAGAIYSSNFVTDPVELQIIEEKRVPLIREELAGRYILGVDRALIAGGIGFIVTASGLAVAGRRRFLL